MQSEYKLWLKLILVVLLAIFLFWFGYRLMSIPEDKMATSELFLLGFIFIGGGLMMTPKNESTNSWLGTLGFVSIGVYFFAKATGVISTNLLSNVFGIVTLSGSFFLLYIAFQTIQKLKSKQKI